MNFESQSDRNRLMSVFVPAVRSLMDGYATAFKPAKVNKVEVWLLAAAMIPLIYNDVWIEANQSRHVPGKSDDRKDASSYMEPNEEVGEFAVKFIQNISFVAAHYLVNFPASLIPGAKYRYARSFCRKLGDRLDGYSRWFGDDVKTLRLKADEPPSMFINMASCGAAHCIRNYEPREGFDGRLLLPMSVLLEYYLNGKKLFLTDSFGADSGS